MIKVFLFWGFSICEDRKPLFSLWYLRRYGLKKNVIKCLLNFACKGIESPPCYCTEGFHLLDIRVLRHTCSAILPGCKSAYSVLHEKQGQAFFTPGSSLCPTMRARGYSALSAFSKDQSEAF